MDAGFRALDHTGDLGVEVWAPSREGLFETASRALVDLLIEPERVATRETHRWVLHGEVDEGLMVRQLEEILFQMDAKGLVFSSFHIQFFDNHTLHCEARGEPLDRERHGFKTEIKAVTYHGLKLWRDGEGRYRAKVIFDV